LEKLIHSIFFGNYFYGLCVVLLSIESAIQLAAPLASIDYYVAVFCGTVLYYTYAYLSDKQPNTPNERSDWYSANKSNIKTARFYVGSIFLASTAVLMQLFFRYLVAVSIGTWLALFSIPTVAILYYGIGNSSKNKVNLRNTGWLKPFIIGFVWAGVVTIYPIFIGKLFKRLPLDITIFQGLLFVKNWLFISMLCIMFDIKDYASDANFELKTFVVSFGLKKTITHILLPISIVGLGSYLFVAYRNHFNYSRIAMNAIPFVLLIIVANSMKKRRDIFYYLVIIDGLMLVKALCGIAGSIL